MNINYGCVKLRAIEMEDTELLLYLLNAPEVECRTVGWHFPISHNEQEQWIEKFRNSDQSIKLMIELSNSKTIGMIMLENLDWKNRTVSFGCKLHPFSKDRIKGDIVDAINGMLQYVFFELGINCVYGVLQEENVFSRKLCKKIGFVEEGTLRQRVYKSGKYKNLISVSMLREEYTKRESGETGEY